MSACAAMRKDGEADADADDADGGVFKLGEPRHEELRPAEREEAVRLLAALLATAARGRERRPLRLLSSR